MRLPGAQRAFVDEKKLINYCLSMRHRRGRHKARVFKSVLGFDESSAPILREALIEAARTHEALRGEIDEHGQRFTIDFAITGSVGSGNVRSIWIVRRGEDFPRLVTCYII